MTLYTVKETGAIAPDIQMQIRDAILDIEYSEEYHAYKVSIWNLRYKLPDGSYEKPTLYIDSDQMPAEYQNQEQKFQVGDLVDKVHRKEKDGQYFTPTGNRTREYMGKITDVKNVSRSDLKSPSRFVYFTDIWYEGRTHGLKQDALELSLNPPID